MVKESIKVRQNYITFYTIFGIVHYLHPQGAIASGKYMFDATTPSGHVVDVYTGVYK